MRCVAAVISMPFGLHELLEQLPVDVRHEIAEAIDPQHLARRARRRSRLARECDSCWMVPADRPSAERSTPFASQPAAGANRSRPSNVRLTVGRAYRRSVSSTTRRAGDFLEHRGQHAVVWRDEPVVARVGRDAPPRGTHARIDDDEKDGARRKVLVAGGQLERAVSTSCGGMSWVMSTSVTSGQIPRMTAFIVPA